MSQNVTSLCQYRNDTTNSNGTKRDVISRVVISCDVTNIDWLIDWYLFILHKVKSKHI